MERRPTLFVLLVVAATCVAACSHPAEPDRRSNDPTPIPTSSRPAISYDGSRLAYIEGDTTGHRLHVLELSDGQDRVIDLTRLAPRGVVAIEPTYALWCPYDRSRLLVHCVTATDTSSADTVAVRTFYGQNAYVVSLTVDTLQRMTPRKYGPTGAPAFGVLGWLSGSSSEHDSLQLGGDGIYLPQTDRFVADGYRWFYTQSRDGHHYLGAESRIGSIDLNVDGRSVSIDPGAIPGTVVGLLGASFSPDDRMLALSLYTDTHPDAMLVLVDVSGVIGGTSTALPATRVAFDDGTFAGYACYRSDTSLVVPLHTGDAPNRRVSLWEVSRDGGRLRRLTY